MMTTPAHHDADVWIQRNYRTLLAIAVNTCRQMRGQRMIEPEELVSECYEKLRRALPGARDTAHAKRLIAVIFRRTLIDLIRVQSGKRGQRAGVIVADTDATLRAEAPECNVRDAREFIADLRRRIDSRGRELMDAMLRTGSQPTSKAVDRMTSVSPSMTLRTWRDIKARSGALQ